MSKAFDAGRTLLLCKDESHELSGLFVNTDPSVPCRETQFQVAKTEEAIAQEAKLKGIPPADTDMAKNLVRLAGAYTQADFQAMKIPTPAGKTHPPFFDNHNDVIQYMQGLNGTQASSFQGALIKTTQILFKRR